MSGFDVDLDYIERLAELLQRTGLTEIELEKGDARLRVAKKQRVVVEAAAQAAAPAAIEPQAQPVPAQPAASAAPGQEWANHPGAVISPIVGTVYLQSEPGAEPFVRAGDSVAAGQTLFVIEAMKVMNTIRAEKAGRLAAILVSNGQAVEFGEPLAVVE